LSTFIIPLSGPHAGTIFEKCWLSLWFQKTKW